jgi:5-methylthioribose kinase
MNLTLRVVTTQRSLVVKQARPWVERYPQIEAPLERAEFERRFYEEVQSDAWLAGMMPRFLGALPQQHLLVLEDLGESLDGTHRYPNALRKENGGVEGLATDRGDPPDDLLVDTLVRWLARLHARPVTEAIRASFQNDRLGRLNHQHIFVIPLAEPPALDLDSITPGLARCGRELARSTTLVDRCRRLGTRYLADGPSLLHGDFYPGSWLETARGVRVIDPEFCRCGAPEFDLGVMLGHLRLIEPHVDWRGRMRDGYRSVSATTVDWELVDAFSGAEIMRRLLGVAQLPLQATLDWKMELLQFAQTSILEVNR